MSVQSLLNFATLCHQCSRINALEFAEAASSSLKWIAVTSLFIRVPNSFWSPRTLCWILLILKWGFSSYSLRLFWSFFGLFAILHFSFLGFWAPFFSAEASSWIAKNEADRLALLDFKTRITNDPLGVLSSWNRSMHLCQWHGVFCSRRNQRDTVLDLQSSKLARSISPHIGNLSFLRLIDLFENSLSQEIRPELGHLSRLKYLYLNKNLLGGEIPTNISFCSNLIEIDVGWNVLVGKIPVEFGSLPKLELLFIHANNLTGGIPLTFLSRNFLRPQIILVAVSPMLLANWKISHILHSMVIGCQVQSLLRSSISLLSEINPCQTINLKALLP